MSGPKRLLDASSPASRLLRPALRDNPDARAAHRAALALGLGSAAATAAGTGAAAAAPVVAAPAAAAAAAAASAPAGALLVATKWVVVGFLGGTVTVGGAAAVGEVSKRSLPEPAAIAAPPSATSARLPAPVTRRAPAPAIAEEVEAPRTAAPVEVAPAAPVAVKPVVRQSPAAVARRDTGGALGRDLSRIDETRRALRSGDPAAALAQLDRYERGRETSFFDREALVLRIEALAKKGEKARAAELADQYFRRFPGDAHAPRLRALLRGKD